MSKKTATPWHKASYDRFLKVRLPELLSDRLPLLTYVVEETGPYSCCVLMTLDARQSVVEVAYDLPTPDESGLFTIDGDVRIVLPVVSDQDLERAEVKCVGEQLFDFVAARLGVAPDDLPWDKALLHAWLPLDTWLIDFLNGNGDGMGTVQTASDTNWLTLHTHLRRLLVPDSDGEIVPGQLGYVCPFETPEGPNVGRILTIATGATIQEGRLVLLDGSPDAQLGLSASIVPFLEHNDPNRLLMGVNMMRQWIPQNNPEPALVQTGNEPDELLAPKFWCGRNLLTAFISWGVSTYEDSILISASCAERFDSPYPLRVGDKLSNRSGTKGVVGKILPDDQMPHLQDGTPVEIVYSFANIHRRMNYGQVREAVVGRCAHKTGTDVIVPPFHAPTTTKMQEACRDAGYPASGMEHLTLGKHGQTLQYPSTVGWVYWGRLFHLAEDKLHTFVDTVPLWGQRVGEMETFMLCALQAYENIQESLNLRAIEHPDAARLSQRLSEGSVAQAEPPTPLFTELSQRLHIAGIDAVLEHGQVTFRFLPLTGNGYKLAQPVPHPWLPERTLHELHLAAISEDDNFHLGDEVASVVAANNRLVKMLDSGTPGKLVEQATVHLKERLRNLFDKLLMPAHLRIGARVQFSGRAVLVPGEGITFQQIGLPEEMAWTLFAPFVTRVLEGDAKAVSTRSHHAADVLDAVMARSWVILNRAPTFEATALLAFHPVRMQSDALQMHPLTCRWLNADFDGDQAAIYLPVTETAQREAGERLSVAAHLMRDPRLLSSLVPTLDVLFGLTHLGLTTEGLKKINAVTGLLVDRSADLVTQASLAHALQMVLKRDGVNRVLDILTKLMNLGSSAARLSGASISPFLGTVKGLPIQPESSDPDLWMQYNAMVIEAMHGHRDYRTSVIGPQLLMSRASGRGDTQLSRLISGIGVVEDVSGEKSVISHGFAEGLTFDEMYAVAAGARRGITSLHAEWARMGASFRDRHVTNSFHVISRALRAPYPGLVFARAAVNHESDPLTDGD
ncbi:MAG: hypothetical protein P1S60_11035, partial [Anaerolineae bacterium]|nr:hypothetical protein [Anaerolineae bacterium]